MVRIGFSTQRANVVSRLIRWLTRSKASHAFLVLEDSVFGNEFVLQADVGGITMVSKKAFVAKGNDLVALFSLGVPLHQGLHEAGELMGTVGYSYLGLLGSFVVLMGRWLRRKWHNPYHSSKALFCSEFVVRVLQATSFPGAEALVPHDTSPEDLVEFLESAPKGLVRKHLPKASRRRARARSQ